MVGGSAEAMVGLVYYFIGIDSCVEWSINSLVVVVDDKATRVIMYYYCIMVNCSYIPT